MERTETRDALRVGIILAAGARLRRWQADCIRQVLATGRVHPAVIVRPPAERPGGMSAIARALSPAAPSQRFTDLPPELAGVPSLDSPPGQLRPDHLARFAIDFLLCFDDRLEWDSAAPAVRLGLWRFRVDAASHTPGASLLDLALTRTDRPGCEPIVLRSGCVAAVRHSRTATAHLVHRELARWPAQVVQTSCAFRGTPNHAADGDGTKTLNGFGAEKASLAVKHNPFRDARLVRESLVRNGWHAARYLFDRLFIQQTWAIGVIDLPVAQLLDTPDPPIRWLRGSSEPYRYLADPFWVGDSITPGGFSLVCEEYDSLAVGRGRLVCAEVTGDEITQTVPIPEIGPGVHVAYPFLIRHGSELFCIPETAEAGGIDLYRSTGPPHGWTKVCRLVEDFPGVDTTAFQHEGRWWLTACSALDGEYHNLFLFYSDSLPGPWRPHAGNPVKCDVRSARPAGTPFPKDGALYRPAQDCSKGYGGSVSINRIEMLTPTRFRETVVARIAPARKGPFPHGLHTLSAASSRTLVDGRRDFFDPLKQIRKRVLWKPAPTVPFQRTMMGGG